MSAEKIDEVGNPAGSIPVELSTRFLEHFSESLYSSPQKAFEELISNGWDAGADYVEVIIPDDLEAKGAALCVLDNGVSMNAEGLKNLWHIAFSTKAQHSTMHGRHVIGKFGIGKLATYVLANKLTYICKANDGFIRRVTMDYSYVANRSQQTPESLINSLSLELYEIDPHKLEESLGTLQSGASIAALLKEGMVPPPHPDLNNEYGGPAIDFEKPVGDTWTVAILSELKPAAKKLKTGILRRMLEAALPIGSDMSICINGERLGSSKINYPTSVDIELGPKLGLTEFELRSDAGRDENAEETVETIKVTSGEAPVPFIEMPEVGKIYGRVRLFQSKIAGGKSDERGSSNGFHVNVRGRLINQDDPSFGEENLSHAAWARFRMTVRADGLNDILTTDRERIKDTRKRQIFRAFLRAVFNRMRSAYDADVNVALQDGGDALVKSLGVISLNPLRNVVSEKLRGQPTLPGLFDDDITEKRDETADEWWADTGENIRQAVSEVKYEKLDDSSFVKFRISDRAILINSGHPFVQEHSRSRAEKELMRTVAMVELLSDIYAIDLGIKPSTIEEVRNYRDKLMRYRAIQHRTSAALAAQLLFDTQHKSATFNQFETAVGDALEHLGFQVERIGGSGEPEGVARAYSYPTHASPSSTENQPPLYKFTYDAKSSIYDIAQTGNLSLDGINEHKQRYKADHALVVAPGFSKGAVVARCQNLEITAIDSSSLARLLQITFSHGAIPLTVLRQMFEFSDPSKVSEWVNTLEERIKSERKLTISLFISALEKLKGKAPDVLAAATISYICREEFGAHSVDATAVKTLVQGLSILVPDLIGLEGENLVVNVSASRLAMAIQAQLETVEPSRP